MAQIILHLKASEINIYMDLFTISLEIKNKGFRGTLRKDEFTNIIHQLTRYTFGLIIYLKISYRLKYEREEKLVVNQGKILDGVLRPRGLLPLNHNLLGKIASEELENFR